MLAGGDPRNPRTGSLTRWGRCGKMFPFRWGDPYRRTGRCRKLAAFPSVAPAIERDGSPSSAPPSADSAAELGGTAEKGLPMSQASIRTVGMDQPTNHPQTPTAFARLSSMLLDHIIMCFLVAVVTLPVFLIVLAIFGREALATDMMEHALEVLTGFIVVVIYFNKDWFSGQSLAKRFMGQRVVYVRTGLPASRPRCFVRNLTIPLWPLEVLITLFSPSRRLGDWLAQTKVVQV
jgi:uncharacterized RDD family membrane protein YckC